MISGSTQTTIGRLGIRAAGTDPWSMRRAAERLLGAVEIHPKSLSPSAILCVRRLADPLPGRFDVRARDRASLTLWSRAVAEALEEAARRAIRPASAQVPPGADAVLFADRGELLACLASDACWGMLSARWWWKHLAAGTTSPGGVAALFVASPEHVPAAFHILAERGEAMRFAREHPASDAEAILWALIERFGLGALARALAPTIRGAVALGAHVEAATSGTGETPRTSTAVASRRRLPVTLEAPWTRWAHEIIEGDGPTLASLLAGVALVVHRAPHEARSLRFAAATVQWLEAAQETSRSARIDSELVSEERTPPHGPSRPADLPPKGDSLSSGPDEGPLPLAERPGPSAHAAKEWPAAAPALAEVHASTEPRVFDAPGDGAPSADRSPSARKVAEPTADAMSPRPAVTPPGPPPEVASPLDPAETSAEPENGASRRPTEPSGNERALPNSYRPAGRTMRVDTALGGLFFLVNVGLYLDLYGDFTQPLRPGVDLPLWDFVALAGSHLLGVPLANGEDRAFPSWTTDPVWELLAHLAGRAANASPGEGFEPPDRWRIPVAWLRPFGDGHTFSWSAAAGRLVVHHPEGFVLVDVALEGEAITQVVRESGPYAESGLGVHGEEARGTKEAGGGSALDRWLGWLMPYVRARLARALGTEAQHVGGFLSRLAARVEIEQVRLDVTMSLAHLPIEIRLAGLDRDPGWVPAAGKTIQFHFE